MRCSIVCVLSLVLCGVARAEPSSPSAADSAASGARARIATLDQLLASLARIEGLRARYHEEKRITLLKRPLQSEGTIEFAAPDLLLRRVEQPEPATMLLKGDTLRVADASGTRSIDLQSNPLVRQFVLTFVHVLSGDRSALERLYSLRFSRVEPARWRLELTPRQPDLARLIERATLEGEDTRVEQMTLAEANGDSTVLRFSQIELGVRYSPTERKRVFRLAGD